MGRSLGQPAKDDVKLHPTRDLHAPNGRACHRTTWQLPARSETRAAVDDMLDAGTATWTARRYLVGSARHFRRWAPVIDLWQSGLEQRTVEGARMTEQLQAVCSGEVEPLYRYSYTRIRTPGTPKAAVVMLNPVHDGTVTDPTTGRCMRLLADQGYGHVTFVNVFAYRHPDPNRLRGMHRSGIDLAGPENDSYIATAVAEAEKVVVAWGAQARRIDPLRVKQVLAMIPEPYCFSLNGDGSPHHPLYLRMPALVRYEGVG